MRAEATLVSRRITTRSRPDGLSAQLLDVFAKVHPGEVGGESGAERYPGAALLTVSRDGAARLWRADTGEPLGQPLWREGSIWSAAFSPDGRIVLTGDLDGTARLWRTDSGEPLGQPMRHERSIWSVAFSPDGRTVVTGSGDGTARLWRADTGEPLGQPMRHEDEIQSVAFSPDGRLVLTRSDDGTARLWRADSGQPVSQPMQHKDRIHAVAFSPDGQTVLAATRWWVHATRLTDEDSHPIASRLLPGSWKWGSEFCFLDPSANQIQVAVNPTPDSVRIITLRLDRPTAQPVQGDPAKLLAEWQKRLGLRITDAGEIVAGRGESVES